MNIQPCLMHKTSNLNFGKKYNSVNISNTLLVNEKSAVVQNRHFRLPKGAILLLAMIITGVPMYFVNKYNCEKQLESLTREFENVIEQIESESQKAMPADTLTLSPELNNNVNLGEE